MNLQYRRLSKFVTDDTIELNLKQCKLLQTIAKQTLLVAIESITMFIIVVNYISFCISTLYNGKTALYITRGLIISTVTMYSISHIIVPICMWFSFVFAENEYHSIFSKWHQSCVNCYQASVIRKLKKIESQGLTNMHDQGNVETKYIMMQDTL